MRFFKFIKWQWDQGDYFGRTTACYFIFCVLPLSISAIWIGSLAFLIAALVMPAIVFGWLLVMIFKVLKNQWEEFNDQVPPDDIAIIRKLKGEQRKKDNH
jgi:hypothetical protein